MGRVRLPIVAAGGRNEGGYRLAASISRPDQFSAIVRLSGCSSPRSVTGIYWYGDADT
jgi:hypothetical protein